VIREAERPCQRAGQPADAAGVSVTRYVVGTGPNLIFNGPVGVRLNQITDGTSNTLLVGEVARRP